MRSAIGMLDMKEQANNDGASSTEMPLMASAYEIPLMRGKRRQGQVISCREWVPEWALSIA
jgi:hypothetical protein